MVGLELGFPLDMEIGRCICGWGDGPLFGIEAKGVSVLVGCGEDGWDLRVG